LRKYHNINIIRMWHSMNVTRLTNSDDGGFETQQGKALESQSGLQFGGDPVQCNAHGLGVAGDVELRIENAGLVGYTASHGLGRRQLYVV
jgi:hypothetical protein